MSETVLVAGATGRQGGAVIRHLLAAGWLPRALTRDPESPRARELRDQGVSVVRGDMRDEDSLLPTMEGVHGVFSVQDYEGNGPKGEVRQGVNMANAAMKAGVRHFVYSSVASADSWSRIDHFETKYMVEGHLRWIGLNRTILRPVRFMENFLKPEVRKGIRKGRFIDPLPRNRKVQLVSVEDVGAFAVAAFLAPEKFMRKIVEIAGDETTNGEIAERLGESTGKEIRFQKIPGFLVRSVLGREMHQMHRWLNRNGFGVDIGALRRSYPEVPITSLRDWLNRGSFSSVTV